MRSLLAPECSALEALKERKLSLSPGFVLRENGNKMVIHYLEFLDPKLDVCVCACVCVCTCARVRVCVGDRT